MRFHTSPINLRDQLIKAGIAELNQNGYHKFSVRRIAAECNVSCAAPYKHFKDKQSFIAAIIEYINEEWDKRQRKIIELYPSPVRRQLLEISMEYIHFLVENPHFRSIIMLKNEEFDNDYCSVRGKLSLQTYLLISRYCKSAKISVADKRRKLFVVRSLIYGAALMFDNGELEDTPENWDMVAKSIDRESDLP